MEPRASGIKTMRSVVSPIYSASLPLSLSPSEWEKEMCWLWSTTTIELQHFPPPTLLIYKLGRPTLSRMYSYPGGSLRELYRHNIEHHISSRNLYSQKKLTFSLIMSPRGDDRNLFSELKPKIQNYHSNQFLSTKLLGIPITWIGST